jgi:hypothetical protein
MENSIRQRMFVKSVVAIAAVFPVFGLSACGGGAGGGDSDGKAGSVTANSAVIEPSTAPIKVEGQATPLNSDLKTVMVLSPPVTWNADGTLPSDSARFAGEQPTAALKAHAPGAYTTLPWDAQVLSLSNGTVTDIAGNGHFAIGRWTAGSDSTGRSYNVNQGRVWALGAPLPDFPIVGNGLRCELIAATRPTASDGNTAPGVLTGATAVVTEEFNSKGYVDYPAVLTLQYSIGSDLGQTFTDDRVKLGSLTFSRQSRSSLATTFFGPNISKPYLVVSYGVHSPTVGLINGIAVLGCAE